MVLNYLADSQCKSDRIFFKLYSSVVTTYTTSLNIQQLYVLPTHCIYVFYMYLRTDSDYFRTQYYLTGFITETQCVFCAVRPECVNNSV
jgi:hypothetical protein